MSKSTQIIESDDQPLDPNWQERLGVKPGDLTVLVGRARRNPFHIGEGQCMNPDHVGLSCHPLPEVTFPSFEMSREDTVRRLKAIIGRSGRRVKRSV